MKRPGLFSSWLGATQIRDPATPAALGYVRNMMLNMDPPEHSRLRQLLARSFTPRAVARLEERIRGHARALCDRAFAGRRGECDFAKDVAADLPLLTLADVLGMPEQDRWLLFDWSNRVIGYQDPDYASSADFDPSGGTPMAAEAVSLRPAPGPDGRMPDPRTRDGMPDLYAYAHLLADAKRRRPGDDVMSILLAQVDDDGGRVSVEEFENMFWLFAVAGNETLRNGLPGACIALLEHPRAQDELRADPGLMPRAVEEMLRWWTPVMTFRRTATADCELGGQRIRAGDKVVVSFTSANRDEAVFADARAVRHPAASQPAPGLRARAAFLPRLPPGPRPDARAVRRGAPPHVGAGLRGRAVLPALELPAGRQAAADRGWAARCRDVPSGLTPALTGTHGRDQLVAVGYGTRRARPWCRRGCRRGCRPARRRWRRSPPPGPRSPGAARRPAG